MSIGEAIVWNTMFEKCMAHFLAAVRRDHVFSSLEETVVQSEILPAAMRLVFSSIDTFAIYERSLLHGCIWVSM